MEIKKITPKTALLAMKYANVGLFYLNDEDVILIDTGHIHESKLLLEFLLEKSLKVKYIINTHGHIDHLGGNFILQDHFKCPIAMPYIDHIYCEDISRYYMSFSTSVVEGLTIYGDAKFETDLLIKETGAFEVCGEFFKNIETPGHTYNHQVIITPDGICFLGDAIMQYETLETAKFAVVTNINQQLKTIEKVANMNFEGFVIGHGENVLSTDDLPELAKANRSYFIQKCQEILFLIEPSITFDHLMCHLNERYGLRKNIFKYFVAERSIKAMLSFLESQGQIKIHIENGMLTYSRRQK